MSGVSIFVSKDEEMESEVPCPDSLPFTCNQITGHFKCCIIKRLKKQCSKALANSWSNPNDFTVEQSQNCGLSNYLFIGSLNDDVTCAINEPRKVLIRLYGEVLRSSMESIVLDSVNFALLSEKGVGPKLHGVFPGGRIEEYIESRPLTTAELPLPKVIEVTAPQLATFHKLHMPFPKKPSFIFKLMDRHLNQLTGKCERPFRPRPKLSSTSLHNLELQIIRAYNEWNVSTPPPFEVVQSLVVEFSLVEEFEWLRRRLQDNYDELFPLVFCHNDFQENNILVLNNPQVDHFYRILPIDFEYAGYNYRGFDIGNHFNEWCYDYTNPNPPYFHCYPDNFPSRTQQLTFWKFYLNEYHSSGVIDNGSRNMGDCEDNILNNGHTNYGCSSHENYVINPDKLWLETIYGALLSHLYWTAWSLIQSQLSSIQFQFLEYARSRMDLYKKMKSWLPSDHWA